MAARSYRDAAGTPLAAEALIGRRARRWDPEGEGFGPPATVASVSAGGIMLRFEGDAPDELCHPNEVTIAAVTEAMIERGAAALFGSYRRQSDPQKVAQQAQTARKHAEVVLRAAVER